MSKKESTVASVFHLFIRECTIYNKAASTINAYRVSFKRFCDVMCGIKERPVGQIGKSDIADYIAALKETGIAMATVNHYIRDLRAFLYWCMENDFLLPYKIKTIKQEKKLKPVYTEEELKVLLRKPNFEDGFAEWRGWLVINLLMGTGVRAGTAVRIKMTDVDLRANRIYTRHNKNGEIYSLIMGKRLKKAIMSFLTQAAVEGAEYLITSVSGEQMTTSGLYQAIEKYNIGRGVTKKSLHLFRHTFSSMWAKNGGDAITLQNILGHSDIRTTIGYINLYAPASEYSRLVKLNPLEKFGK